MRTDTPRHRGKPGATGSRGIEGRASGTRRLARPRAARRRSAHGASRRAALERRPARASKASIHLAQHRRRGPSCQLVEEIEEEGPYAAAGVPFPTQPIGVVIPLLGVEVVALV